MKIQVFVCTWAHPLIHSLFLPHNVGVKGQVRCTRTKSLTRVTHRSPHLCWAPQMTTKQKFCFCVPWEKTSDLLVRLPRPQNVGWDKNVVNNEDNELISKRSINDWNISKKLSKERTCRFFGILYTTSGVILTLCSYLNSNLKTMD